MSLWSKYWHHKRSKAVDTKSCRTSYTAQRTKHISTTELYIRVQVMIYLREERSHWEPRTAAFIACLHSRNTANLKDRAAHKIDAWSNNRTSAYVQIAKKIFFMIYRKQKFTYLHKICLQTSKFCFIHNPCTYYWQCKATTMASCSAMWGILQDLGHLLLTNHIEEFTI